MANELQGIYNRLNGAAGYHPFTATTFGDWSLEAGDTVTMSRDSNTQVSPVSSTSLVWRGSPELTLESTGEQKRPSVAKLSARKYGGWSGNSGVRSLGRQKAKNEEIHYYIEDQVGGAYTAIDVKAGEIMTEVGNRFTGVATRFEQNESKIGMVVGTNDDGNYIKAGEICLAINDDGSSSAHINATHIYFNQNESLSEWASGIDADIYANSAAIETITSKWINTDNLSASIASLNYVAVKDILVDVAEDRAVSIKNAIYSVQKTTSGDEITLHFYGIRGLSQEISSVTFNKATVSKVSGSWSGGNTYTVSADPNGQALPISTTLIMNATGETYAGRKYIFVKLYKDSPVNENLLQYKRMYVTGDSSLIHVYLYDPGTNTNNEIMSTPNFNSTVDPNSWENGYREALDTIEVYPDEDVALGYGQTQNVRVTYQNVAGATVQRWNFNITAPADSGDHRSGYNEAIASVQLSPDDDISLYPGQSQNIQVSYIHPETGNRVVKQTITVSVPSSDASAYNTGYDDALRAIDVTPGHNVTLNHGAEQEVNVTYIDRTTGQRRYLSSFYISARSGSGTYQEGYNLGYQHGSPSGSGTAGGRTSGVSALVHNFTINRNDGTSVTVPIDCSSIYSTARQGYTLGTYVRTGVMVVDEPYNVVNRNLTTVKASTEVNLVQVADNCILYKKVNVNGTDYYVPQHYSNTTWFCIEDEGEGGTKYYQANNAVDYHVTPAPVGSLWTATLYTNQDSPYYTKTS